MKDKNVTYMVVPEYQTRWFRKGRLVYKLFRNYFYWYDASGGNGGGDYREAKDLIHTFLVESDAIEALTALNKVYE